MIVAFYSLATHWHHQVTLLDANEVPRAARSGEGMQVVDQPVFNAWRQQMALGGDRDAIQEYLNTFTFGGVAPQPCEYAIVQGVNVVNVVGRCDPALGHLDNELASRPGAIAVLTAAPAAIGAVYDPLLKTITNPVQAVLKQVLGAL